MTKDETQLEVLPPEDSNLPAEAAERHSHQDQDYDYVRNNLQDII